MPSKTRKPTGSTHEVTSAAAWRSGDKQGFVIELPSGNVARLRRTLNLPELLNKGKIPNPLAPLLNDMLAQKKSVLEVKPDDEEGNLYVLQMVDLIDSQIPRIFVEPKVQALPRDWDEDEKGEWEPDEGCIALHEIDPEDKMFAFAFAQGGPDDVATFRAKQKENVDAVANESNLAREAKRVGGAKRR